MPRSVKLASVADPQKIGPLRETPQTWLPRPQIVVATLLFWSAVVIGLKLFTA